ncbi:MAG: hypothetical protein Q6373_019410 [Candidatus Sigynarchaeota archaeon]
MMFQDASLGVLIAAILAATLFFLILLITRFWVYPRKKTIVKRRTREYLTEKFEDLLALRAILVARKDSGILLYSYIVENEDDVAVKSPDFLSGVVHAIQNIGKEMGFNEQFSRLVYGNYHIIAIPGQYCNVILVSRTEPSSVIEDNMLLLVRSFEKKFSVKLRENTGYVNIADYEATMGLIRDIFDTFYIENMNLLYDPLAIKIDDVSKLGKTILDQALVYYKKHNFVCLKNLFIDLVGGSDSDVQKKKFKDEIVQEMYELYKANYFTFFST